MNVSSLRATSSTPALGPSTPTGNPGSQSRGRLRPPEHSSSYIATNKELSIVDISSFNYNSYRHKLIESALRKRYGGNYPPGNVILNSIQLNSVESSVETELNDKYSRSFFDFIDECYYEKNLKSKPEMEYLHPLDHFVVKPVEKPLTIEKYTETMDTTDDELSDVSTPLTPSTPLSRPITRRRTSSAAPGCVISNASSRCPLSRVSSKSPSVRPTCVVGSRSLSSESADRVTPKASCGSPKVPIGPQLYHQTENSVKEYNSGNKSSDIKAPVTKVSKKATHPRTPEAPGTPDSCVEPIAKKLKVTKRPMSALTKSILENQANHENVTKIKNAPDIFEREEQSPVEVKCALVKPTPAISMIPRPARPITDYDQPRSEITETAETMLQHASPGKEAKPVFSIKDSPMEPDTSQNLNEIILSSSGASQKFRSTNLGTTSRRQVLPLPAWNSSSSVARSLIKQNNDVTMEAEKKCNANTKRVTTPRPRNYDSQNRGVTRKCDSNPPSGTVSRNPSPNGRPKTASALTASERRSSSTRTSCSKLPTALPARKNIAKATFEKVSLARCKSPTSKTPTEKSSLTLSISHDGSSLSRNLISESSSGLLQSLDSSNSTKCMQPPTLSVELSSSSSGGMCDGNSILQNRNKLVRQDKAATHSNETKTKTSGSRAINCLELAQKRRPLPGKFSINSVSAPRSKITTAPNSRLPSPRSKHSTEVSNACETPDETATTLREPITVKDVKLTKVEGSRAKSESRSSCRAKSESSRCRKPRDNSMDGQPSLRAFGVKEVKRENYQLDRQITSTVDSELKYGGKSSNPSSVTSPSSHISSKLKAGDSFGAKISTTEGDRIETMRRTESKFVGEIGNKGRIRLKDTTSRIRSKQSLAASPAVAEIQRKSESKLTLAEKFPTDQVVEEQIATEKMKSRDLSENRNNSKLLKNNLDDEKPIHSFSFSTDKLGTRKKSCETFDEMRVDSEILFCLDYPPHWQLNESNPDSQSITTGILEVKRETSTRRTRIPSPITTKLVKASGNLTGAEPSKYSGSLRSPDRRMRPANPEILEPKLPGKPQTVKKKASASIKTDLSEVSNLVKGNTMSRHSAVMTSHEKTRQDDTDEPEESSRMGKQDTEKIHRFTRGRSTKAESVIQRSLRNYIKKLKVVLSDENSNVAAEEMASINLTDAILPDMRSVLESTELNRLESLLELAEQSTTLEHFSKKPVS